MSRNTTSSRNFTQTRRPRFMLQSALSFHEWTFWINKPASMIHPRAVGPWEVHLRDLASPDLGLEKFHPHGIEFECSGIDVERKNSNASRLRCGTILSHVYGCLYGRFPTIVVRGVSAFWN